MKRPWGVVKRRGDAYTLLCDFDTRRRPPLGPLCGVLAAIGVPAVALRYERSHSGRWHVEIRTAFPLTSGEQVAAQLLLGSDVYREAYNLARVVAGARPPDWNLLFAFKCAPKFQPWPRRAASGRPERKVSWPTDAGSWLSRSVQPTTITATR